MAFAGSVILLGVAGLATGLTYGVAPGVRTGVGVSLGDEQTPDGRRLTSDAPAPRVRLETTFKF